MTEYIVRALVIFKPIYRSMGVNFDQLRTIVDVKLIMDNRRQHVYSSRKQKADPENTFLLTLGFYALFGAFIAAGLMAVQSFGLAMTMFFSYIMVMTAMTLITDFSSILLDTSDNTIVLPRPVDSRTLFAARLTHIILYLGQITIGLCIFPSIVVLLKYGVVLFVLFLVAVLLSIIATLFITNTFYLLILQFASEEKLRNVINYFQIIMAVFIMGGYQLLPRVAGQFRLSEYVFEIQWWHALVPPFWMSGALDMFYTRSFDAAHWSIAAIAVIAPVAGFYLVNQYLTPVFTRKLGAIGTETAVVKQKTEKQSFASRVGKWLTRTTQESAAFELIYTILGRDRKIKLKVYPAFGYVLVFGFVFMFRSSEDLATVWSNLPDSHFHILLLYLCFMVLQVAVQEIPYSDDFKASWVYFSAPVAYPGEILSGMIKAIILRLFVPAYTVIAMGVIAIWGFRVIDDVLFAMMNNLFLICAIALVNRRMLPQSMAPNLRSQAGSFIRSMILLVIVGGTGVIHYFISGKPVFVLTGVCIQTATVFLLFTLYRKTSWEKISV